MLDSDTEALAEEEVVTDAEDDDEEVTVPLLLGVVVAVCDDEGEDVSEASGSSVTEADAEADAVLLVLPEGEEVSVSFESMEGDAGMEGLDDAEAEAEDETLGVMPDGGSVGVNDGVGGGGGMYLESHGANCKP